MHCDVDDLDKNKEIKHPALYKSEEMGIVVYVFDIECGIVYYIRLDGKSPAGVENCPDWEFIKLFTYFHGIAHLSN